MRTASPALRTYCELRQGGRGLRAAIWYYQTLLDHSRLFLKPPLRVSSHGNPRTFNMEAILAQNIVASTYFKRDLLEWPDCADLVTEAREKVTHVEPFAPGEQTPHARGTYRVVTSCTPYPTPLSAHLPHLPHTHTPSVTGGAYAASPAFCLLYRLLLTRLTAKELGDSLLRSPEPLLRAMGLLYVRYTCPPALLWDWFVEPLEDDATAFSPGINAASSQTTLAAFAQALLSEPRYFNSQLPPLPVKLKQELTVKVLLAGKDRERRATNARRAGGDASLLRAGAAIRARYTEDDVWYDAVVDGPDDSSSFMDCGTGKVLPPGVAASKAAARAPDPRMAGVAPTAAASSTRDVGAPTVRARYWVTYTGFGTGESVSLGRIELPLAQQQQQQPSRGGVGGGGGGGASAPSSSAYDGGRAGAYGRGGRDDRDRAAFDDDDRARRRQRSPSPPHRGAASSSASTSSLAGGGGYDRREGAGGGRYDHRDESRGRRSRSRSRSIEYRGGGGGGGGRGLGDGGRGDGSRGRDEYTSGDGRRDNRGGGSDRGGFSEREGRGGEWGRGGRSDRRSHSRSRSPPPRRRDDGAGFDSSRPVFAEDTDSVDVLRRQVAEAARAGAVVTAGSRDYHSGRPAGVSSSLASRGGEGVGGGGIGRERAGDGGRRGGQQQHQSQWGEGGERGGHNSRSNSASRSAAPARGPPSSSSAAVHAAPAPPVAVPPPAPPTAAALARSAALQSRYGGGGGTGGNSMATGAARDGDEDVLHIRNSWAR